MVAIIDEIFNEIKSNCNNNVYNHLKSFITMKLHGYRITEEETSLIKYEMSDNERLFKMFFISKKLQGLSERTLKIYSYEIKKFIDAVNKPLASINTDDVRYYLACYQLAGKATGITIDNTRRYLSTFFKWLEDEDHIAKSPLKKIKKTKYKKKVKKSFNFEEVEKLKMACEDKREIALINFLLSTGTRAEETTNIKLRDIDFNTGEVRVTGKGNKERMVFLNATALLRLKDYLADRRGTSEYVFSGQIKPYDKIGVVVIEKMVRDIGKRAGVENVHPHRFRRTCATIASKRGMPIEEIQKMLGHENLCTTQIYVQVDVDDIRKAHEKYMN